MPSLLGKTGTLRSERFCFPWNCVWLWTDRVMLWGDFSTQQGHLLQTNQSMGPMESWKANNEVIASLGKNMSWFYFIYHLHTDLEISHLQLTALSKPQRGLCTTSLSWISTKQPTTHPGFPLPSSPCLCVFFFINVTSVFWFFRTGILTHSATLHFLSHQL